MKPARPPEPAIVHRDDDLLVLDKPPFLPTTSPDGGDCLVARAKRLDPRAERLHPTSRLDAEVTGLVTFARSTRAIEAVAAARAEGRYRRRYLALAAGALVGDVLTWDFPIAIDPRDPRRRVIAEHPDAKPSRTLAEPERALADATLLVLFPQTGRTHQLRLHASHVGHPLLGDAHYGGARRVALPTGRMLAFPRVMLHCAEIVLPRVRGEGALTLRADIPSDFRDAFRALAQADTDEALVRAASRAPRALS